jgi:hypothetical protein
VIATVAALGPWAWVILGLALMGVELVAPGLFLIWLGLAALVTAALVALLGLGWQASAAVFALISVALVLMARLLLRRKGEEPAAPGRLNAAARDLIGRTVLLDQPIVEGEGHLRLGDTLWRATGPDLAAGTRVRITGVVGTALKVEPA